MNGKVAIDTEGNIVTTGDISAKTMRAQKYEVNDKGDYASAGEAVVPTGEVEITITTKAVTSNSRILVTPNAPVLFGVVSKIAGQSFSIQILSLIHISEPTRPY